MKESNDHNDDCKYHDHYDDDHDREEEEWYDAFALKWWCERAGEVCVYIGKWEDETKPVLQKKTLMEASKQNYIYNIYTHLPKDCINDNSS